MKSNSLISFLILISFFSCKAKSEFGLWKWKVKENKNSFKLPKVIAFKDSLFEIKSISVASRIAFHHTDFNRSKITNEYGNKVFNRFLSNFWLLKSNTNWKITYNGSNQNDSLYKSNMDSTFYKSFIDTAIQAINFSGIKTNGIHLFITNALFYSDGGFRGGGGQGGVSTDMITVYEFFNIQNGKALAYTGLRYA